MTGPVAHRQSRVGPGTVTDHRLRFLPSGNRERAMWHMGVSPNMRAGETSEQPSKRRFTVQEKEMGSVLVRVLRGNTTNSISIDT